MKNILILPVLLLPLGVQAQESALSNTVARPGITDGMTYRVEMQSSLSDGNTPLWLNANRHGLSSLKGSNGYVRAAVIRPLATDSLSRWAWGYGVDMAAAYGFTSRAVVQQAFAELRWLHGTLSVGSKEYGMELRNDRLSSGPQTLGINARPVPQVRLALPDYYTLPFANSWLKLKGHIAYGMLTDNSWQHDFTKLRSKYVDNTRYHSKAGYLKIGKEEAFYPLSLELGLEMATLFGGDTYIPTNGTVRHIANDKSLKSFWRALIPGGGEQPEKGGAYENAEGDFRGSWLMRINYTADSWALHVYADHFFEDHSAMFHLDYDGYGTGDDWDKWKKRRFFLYDFKDMMLGAELELPYGHWLKGLVFEYLYTKYQSGPVYHDHTPSIPDHVAGGDNYYNHYIYAGWQHWGQVMGNPLFRSPIYNTDGRVEVENSRFTALHIGVSGSPTARLDYRMLATWQEGLGTYNRPFDKPLQSVSVMAEACYRPWRDWTVTGAFGMDFGSIYGRNTGFQLTLAKSWTTTGKRRH